MIKSVQTDGINISVIKNSPELLEEFIKAQRVELFRQLPIEDGRPIILTFHTTDMNDLLAALGDPLGKTTIRTSVEIQVPETNYVVVNKLAREKYKEHKGFWAKLKLLFSKKVVYTKEVKEI
jgi:hypothetical protein